MRAPAILAQCLPGLVPHDRGSLSIASSIFEKDIHLASPAVEILPSKVQLPFLSSANTSPSNQPTTKKKLYLAFKAFFFACFWGYCERKCNGFKYVPLQAFHTDKEGGENIDHFKVRLSA